MGVCCPLNSEGKLKGARQEPNGGSEPRISRGLALHCINTRAPELEHPSYVHSHPHETTTMSSSVPLQIAETIQTASINRAPSPSHDLNPSSAASAKQPVTVDSSSSISLDKYTYDDEDGIDEEDEEEEDIPYDVIRPTPRRASFPPLPDLRFEQSYLASIAGADTRWKVAIITLRDQVCARHS